MSLVCCDACFCLANENPAGSRHLSSINLWVIIIIIRDGMSCGAGIYWMQIQIAPFSFCSDPYWILLFILVRLIHSVIDSFKMMCEIVVSVVTDKMWKMECSFLDWSCWSTTLFLNDYFWKLMSWSSIFKSFIHFQYMNGNYKEDWWFYHHLTGDFLNFEAIFVLMEGIHG